jgi:DNA-binding transcriptional ArsR family regulator
MSTDDGSSAIELTASSLRGIAHPLRVRILGLLREHGPATATLLAERLGQSTGATSYHLRQLAQYGFIEDDPDRGVGRERWWRASHRMTRLDPAAALAAPVESEAYMRAVAAANAERVDRWLGELLLLPPEWQNSRTLSDFRLHLTADEARDLHDRMFELIGRYRRADDPAAGAAAPAAAESVVLQVQLMPFLARTAEGADRAGPEDGTEVPR